MTDSTAAWIVLHQPDGWVAATEHRTNVIEWTGRAILAKRFTIGQAKEVQIALGGAIVAAAGDTVWEKTCSANGKWMDYAICPRWRIFKRRRLFEEAVREEMWAMRGALDGLMAVGDFDHQSH